MTGPVWRKARACGANGTCVEVGHGQGHGVVLVRDSADPGGPRIALDREQWAGLVAVIKEDR